MICLHFAQSLRGVPLVHSMPRGVTFYEIWGFKGGPGVPIGHSLGSLFVDLRTLWQHMFGMPAFIAIRVGFGRQMA